MRQEIKLTLPDKYHLKLNLKLIYDKFYPLRRLMYLGFKIFVIPVQVVTEFLYLFYHTFSFLNLETIVVIHKTRIFSLLQFMINHICFIIIQHTPSTNFKVMITG